MPEIKMYAILADFDEVFAKMDAGTAAIVKKWTKYVTIDPNFMYVAFLFRTKESRRDALPHIRAVYPSAVLADRPAYVDSVHLREGDG